MENLSQNKMATQPINKLMLNMGIPIILSMMLQALYNIVDSAFVSNIPGSGELALNALTIAFPVQMLMVAISIGTGVGVNALLSKSLGQNDKQKVNQTSGNALFLGLIIYVLFVLFTIFGIKPYIASQTQNSQISKMAIDYLMICCGLSFGIVYFSLFEKILQATGKSLYSTIAQVSGAIVNIILDPIFIYAFNMGVQGAAWATIIGQVASFLVGLFFHIKYNKEIENKIHYCKPNIMIISNIYTIGIPAIIGQALMSFMTYFLNIIFIQIGENVVTAYGLYYKIQQFILFAAFGLRDAITPIISFNHGMNNKQRVQEGIKYGMIYTLVIMLVGLICLEVFANPIATLFGLSNQTQDLCVNAIRIVSLSFIFAGANIALQGIFQALNKGLESLIVSICRQLLFVIPVAYIFVQMVLNGSNINIIWYTFIISEILSLLISLFFMRNVNKKTIQAM